MTSPLESAAWRGDTIAIAEAIGLTGTDAVSENVWWCYSESDLQKDRHFLCPPTQLALSGPRSVYGRFSVGPRGWLSEAAYMALIDGGVTNGLARMLYHSCAVLVETQASLAGTRGLLSALSRAPHVLHTLLPDGSPDQPWQGCIHGGREGMCRLFLLHACELLDSTDADGLTPLMHAIRAIPSATTAERDRSGARRRQHILATLLDVTLADDSSLATTSSEEVGEGAPAGSMGVLDVLPDELLLLVLRFFVAPRNERTIHSLRNRARLRCVCRAGRAHARSAALGSRLAANRRNHVGECALHMVARIEDTSLATAAVARLLRAGADINAKDAGGRSVLSHACGVGHAALVDELLRRGASLAMSVDRQGFTALHDVCSGAPHALDPPLLPVHETPYVHQRRLANYRAEVRARDVVVRRHAECAGLLLSRGAGPLARTRSGALPDLPKLGLPVAVLPPPPAELGEMAVEGLAVVGRAAEGVAGVGSVEVDVQWVPPPPPAPQSARRGDVATLVGMGFDEQAAMQALMVTSGDVDEAALLLFAE